MGRLGEITLHGKNRRAMKRKGVMCLRFSLSKNVYTLYFIKCVSFSCSSKARNQDVATKRNAVFIFLKLLCLQWLVYFSLAMTVS